MKPHHQRKSSSVPASAHLVSVFICNYSVVSFAQIWVVMKCSRFLFHFLKTVISSQCSLSSPANFISINILMPQHLQGFMYVLESILSWSLSPSFGHLSCWALIHLNCKQSNQYHWREVALILLRLAGNVNVRKLAGLLWNLS